MRALMLLCLAMIIAGVTHAATPRVVLETVLSVTNDGQQRHEVAMFSSGGATSKAYPSQRFTLRFTTVTSADTLCYILLAKSQPEAQQQAAFLASPHPKPSQWLTMARENRMLDQFDWQHFIATPVVDGRAVIVLDAYRYPATTSMTLVDTNGEILATAPVSFQ